MSRLRTYVVGRERGCDVPLDDASVSRRHAEIVRVSGGGLYVTDCATTNGTFVRDGGDWRAIRQAFLEPDGRVRFGGCEMTAAELAALCRREDASPPGAGRDAGGAQGGSVPAAPEEAAPDPRRGLVRDPETGEILEQQPPAHAWRRGR